MVVYTDLDDAFAALERQLPPRFFLSPLHTATDAVVALHAANVEVCDVDERRVCRHLCHEFAHVFAAERSESLKCLGDGNRHMRIRTWVNEGFAECVASVAANCPDVVRSAMAASSGSGPSSHELDENLDDLMNPDRSRMFSFATATVWRSIEAHGMRFVFDHLDEPARWCDESR